MIGILERGKQEVKKSIFIILGLFSSSVLPFLIIIVIVLASIGIGSQFSSDGGRSGGADIVKVALAEEKEENNGGRKFWTFMGWASRDSWCAAFVSWCANELGFIESGIIPKSGWCNDFRNFYKDKDRWEVGQGHGGAYTPKEGDLILFQWQGSVSADLDHIGIVVAVEAGRVTTIEGNSGDRVAKRSYGLDSKSIIGYGLPAYPSSSSWNDKLEGGTNAEMVYNFFIREGYTREAAAGIVGNLAWECGLDENGDLLINNTESNGEGVGICQWSFGRKTAFLLHAELRGEPFPNTSLGVQLEFLLMEITTNQWIWTSIGAEYGNQYNITHEEFKNSKDITVTTTAFCAKFERCHKRHSNLANRIEYAKGILANYG